MLRYGIPAFRLPEKILDQELSFVRSLGIEIRSQVRIDSPHALLESGYDAVFVATGAWNSTTMGIEGEDLPETIDGIHFLRRLRQGEKPALGRRVVVVGGGNTAIDAARTAVRCGAAVEIIYRRSQAEMPADAEEVHEAIEEGVIIRPLILPVKIVKGHVVCVTVQTKETDASGRGMPEPMWGSEHSLPCDTLIVAIGQTADARSIHLEESGKGMVRVDKDTLSTAHQGVFAGGDVVTGPSSIIEAIAQGRRASESMDRFLGGTGAIPEKQSAEPDHPFLPDTAARGALRRSADQLELQKRRTTFEVVERVYEESEAVAEAARCLSCDLRDFEVRINGAICKDCGYCREICSLGVFSQQEQFNALGFRPAHANDSEKCVGCLRCFHICPDLAITVQQRCGS
jgi:NADPH-dependent glutamate synthase beta subunit-like oxidoreductase